MMVAMWRRDRPRGASVTIRVFLLDDHEVVQRGVRDLLEAQSDGDVEVAGEAGTAEEISPHPGGAARRRHPRRTPPRR